MKALLKKLDRQLEPLVQAIDSSLEPLVDVTTGAVFTAGPETMPNGIGQQPRLTLSAAVDGEGQLPRSTSEKCTAPIHKPSLDYNCV